ncbi:G protein-coupled glucose receptor regulating Gpa2-domain-containing protein [Apodospora peruviana]|uniref:G protein-coupled glucose receptor regulating Gpa2-domain-containing protein n=1 Tax=Apodospora peruviana TaxID=516989 RepID=A0AAE0I5A7_9PEZI|nr:G protein-coupled glucose receptor regulating Gpa2-domain-containing protein [Apodospora peruviana]
MADSNGYYPLGKESDTLNPLPDAHRQGLVAVAVLAGISFGSSAIVLFYLTFKLIRWHIQQTRRSRPTRESANGEDPFSSPVDLSLGIAERHFTGAGCRSRGGRQHTTATTEKRYPNQFLVLIYNLLLADLHQAAAFLLNGIWVGENAIQVHRPACFLQGWLVSTGDLASSCFITAIAVHTYLAVVWRYRPSHKALYSTIVGLWIFDYLLASLGPAVTHNGREHGGFYVRAAAWCWISVKYETHRLVLHYLFIFIALVMTSALYMLIFLSLRRQQHRQHDSANMRSWLPTTSTTPIDSGPGRENSSRQADKTTAHSSGGHHKAFLLYPVIYVVCTAPLAVGRIATMAKANVPVAYFCVAGALIGSNGWLDVLLWGLTRHNLLFNSDVDSEDTGLDTFTFMRTPPERKYGNIVWVEGASIQRPGSVDNESHRSRLPSLGWIKRRMGMGWERLDLRLPGLSGMITRKQEDSSSCTRQVGRRTVSQESLRGSSTTIVRQQHMQNEMAIQMDMVTSVVVEKRKEELVVETQFGQGGEYPPRGRGGDGDADDGNFIHYVDSQQELQDPSGYLTSVEEDVKAGNDCRRFGNA